MGVGDRADWTGHDRDAVVEGKGALLFVEDAAEGVVSVEDVGGVIGVVDGALTPSGIVVVIRDDSALPGAFGEATAQGVFVGGAVAVVIFLTVEETGGLVVEPGGGGGGGTESGHGLHARCIVVAVLDTVGLVAFDFVDGAVGVMDGFGDVVVVGIVRCSDRVKGVGSIDVGAAAARIVCEFCFAVAGIGDGFDEVGGGGEVFSGGGAGAGLGLFPRPLEGVVLVGDRRPGDRRQKTGEKAAGVLLGLGGAVWVGGDGGPVAAAVQGGAGVGILGSLLGEGLVGIGGCGTLADLP